MARPSRDPSALPWPRYRRFDRNRRYPSAIETTRRTKPFWRRALPPAVAAAVIVLTFAVVLPSFANYGEVWKVVRALSWGWVAALLFGALLNLATFAPNWMAALPGLSYERSLRLTMSGTALANVAPLGGAVSMGMQYGMLRAWGFSRAHASRAMVITGVWNNLVNLGLPLVGLVALTLRGGKNAALEVSAQIGAVVFVVVLIGLWQILRSDGGARRMGRMADRGRNLWQRTRGRTETNSGPETLAAFRRDSIELLRDRWLALTLTTILGVLTVYLVLAIAIRAMAIPGVQVTYTEAFAAWSGTRLLSTAFPVTPGGLGIVEVGLTGALTGFGGTKSKVVAAVLLYRLLTWVPPIVVGAFSVIGWRRGTEAKETVSPVA